MRTFWSCSASPYQWVVNPPQPAMIVCWLNEFTPTTISGSHRNSSTSRLSAAAKGWRRMFTARSAAGWARRSRNSSTISTTITLTASAEPNG